MLAELPALVAEGNLIGTLQKCRQQKNLHQAMHLHAYIRQQHLESDPVLGNYLVPLMVDCGSLACAQQIFDRLPLRNEHSWTSLISGYIDGGDPEYSFCLYHKMQEESCAQPNRYTYVALLNACTMLKDVQRGQSLHAEMTKKGLETELHVGSTMVDTYTKCGFLVEARAVFDRLPIRDAVSWNALIAGYVKDGRSEEVLNSLKCMQLEGIPVSAVTYVCSLKACAAKKALQTGQELHAEILKVGLEKELYISTALVNMYTNCGSPTDALQVFDLISVRNAVLWNALITGYTDQGLGDEALTCFQQMHVECMSPDSVTYTCSLKACAQLGTLDRGQAVHAEVITRGFEEELNVVGALMDMYSKCGCLQEAQRVFDRFPLKNTVMWTALISGYSEQGHEEEVLLCYQRMKLEGCYVDIGVFVLCLKACAAIPALELGQKIHAEVVKWGLENDLPVGSTLVDLYSQCSLLAEARQAIDCLPIQNTVMWNALIGRYSELGFNEEVLRCIQEMQVKNVVADSLTFISSLRACSNMETLEKGQELHAEIIKRKMETDLHVGNTLVDMYCKCGSLAEAQKAFEMLPVQDTVSWNARIGGYADHGLSEEALNSSKLMHLAQVSADAVTFVLCLKACSNLGAYRVCQDLHAEVIKTGLEADLYIGSMLIDTYSKFGLFAEACQVFDKLPVQNVVSWNILIAAYTEHGLGEEAVSCFKRMWLEGVSRNAVTFVCSLKACGTILALEIGQEIHAEATKWGLEGVLHVSSALVDMYGKCSSAAEAHRVFQSQSVQNTVSWNALIAGFAEHGLSEEVLKCYEQMQVEGIFVDAVTQSLCCSACGTIGALEIGRQVHAGMVKRGLDRELHMASTVLDMYGKCGLLDEALQVFSVLPFRDVVLWNALIAAHFEAGLAEDVLIFFKRMSLESVSVDAASFICSLKACTSVGDLETGQNIYMEIIKRGLEKYIYVGSTLVDMYGKCGFLVEAHEVFDRLPVQTVASWNALLAGYAEQGLDEDVLNCFEEMQLQGVYLDAVTFLCSLKACGITGALETGRKIHGEVLKKGLEKEVRIGGVLVDMYAKCGSLAEAHSMSDSLPARNAVSWNVLITGYTESELGEEALHCFKQMQLEGISADAVTYVFTLKACGSIGALETGREIHMEINKLGLHPDSFVCNVLVEMYGKCGSVAEGQNVFEKLPNPDVVLWTAMIKTYGENHQGIKAIWCYEKMLRQGVRPNSNTFACLLAACSHANLVCKGQEYFKAMHVEHGIEPTLDHFACMIDLFARSGHVYEAERLLDTMQHPPSTIILMNLLTACKIYGKLELGQKCFQQLLLVNQEDASAYLLMSDVYAGAGRWNDADRVEEWRKCTKAKKKPGTALIEVNQNVHEFAVGVKHSADILKEAEVMSSFMKHQGHIPSLDLICRYDAASNELADGSMPHQ